MKRIMVSKELFESLNLMAQRKGLSVTDYVSCLVSSVRSGDK